MVFKEASDCCTGTCMVYGAPDIKKMAQFFNGTAIDCAEPVIPRDTIFTISDATCPTSLIRFSALSITACTTRVVTVPDANITINRCIAISNLADGTDGELITWDMCASPTTVAVGTCGQFLQSQGVGCVPVFACIPNQTESFVIAVGDETTALSIACAIVTFRMPYAFTVTEVRGSVTTAPTGCMLLTVDIHETGTTIMACCKIVFDAGEFTTTTAATAPVVSDSALADDAEITIDIDTIGSTIAGAGLKVYIIGTRT